MLYATDVELCHSLTGILRPFLKPCEMFSAFLIMTDIGEPDGHVSHRAIEAGDPILAAGRVDEQRYIRR